MLLMVAVQSEASRRRGEEWCVALDYHTGGAMDYNKALFTREAWGIKPCKHARMESEYFMGKNTGKTVCSVCGKLYLAGVPFKA
jgi:hypothetical protein